jgi:hypothetical protein
MFVLILVASLFYKTVICKYIKKCSRFNFYLGYVTFLVATGLSALSRALAYDLQISFGQIFFMLAITILLKLENKTKHEYLLYMLLGIFTALIVVSKANMVVLYIPITYLYIKLLKEKKYSTSKLIKVLLSTFTLFTLIAIFQMVYNYIRFDSIFEFGTKYQLTVADMRYGTVLSLNRMMYGIMLALFTIPRFSIFEFPFISEGNVYVDVLGFNEYMFKHYTVGILAIPIIYVLFFKGKLKQNKENNESNNLLKIINIFIITSAIILCVDIIFAGMSDRYLIDIRVMLIISSILCVLKRLETLYKKDKQKYDLYQTLFYILALTSILVMLPIAITYEEAQVKLADLTFLKNMLMFWI